MSASRGSSISASLSTTAVFERSRNLLDKQRNAAEQERQSFAAERALWDIERQALYARVQELEQALSLKNGQTMSKQSVSAISPEIGSPPFGNFSNKGGVDGFGSFPNGNGAIHTSTESDGDEFWRGAGARKGSVATRTFSDSSARSGKPEDRRLPSIAETESPDKPSEALASTKNTASGTAKTQSDSSGGAKRGSDFDGIKFRSLLQLPENAVLTPESPSPKQSISPPCASPGHIEVPSHTISAPEDILIRDAGHTPLARATERTGNSSGVASNAQTPIQEGPRHPRASVAHPPSERSNSYFPPPPDDDEDPELKGPLNLQNDGANDKAFLDELDSKLTDAAMTTATTNESVEKTKLAENHHPSDRAESAPVPPNFDQPELEPRLKMRRSMNFGAPLGSVRHGKI